jgi:hypothetical protein
MPVAAAQTMEDVLAIDGEARSRAGERIGTQSGALRMTAP